MTASYLLRPVEKRPRIHRLISRTELDSRLRQDIRRHYVDSGQWYRVADLYLKLGYGNTGPLDAGIVHSELFHLHDCSEPIIEFSRDRLLIYFGVGAGTVEMALADLLIQTTHHLEAVLVDVNPVFLRMFVAALFNRRLEDHRYSLHYLGLQTLFERFPLEACSPCNSGLKARVFVCLGSTIGNFDVGQNLFKAFSRLASPGDRLLVGYQTEKYLSVTFQKYRQHPGYSRLVGNFLRPNEKKRIEWNLDEKKSTIEAWHGNVQLFRAHKFKSGEVKQLAEKHSWISKFRYLDPFGNMCLHGFQKK